jgi:hypothetical protein
MYFSMRPFLAFFAAITLLSGAANAQSGPINLTVDAAAGTHAIDPNIYGMSNYGLDAAFAKEIKLPNYRWGGDGTTRYNWMVDSSNSGNDWYFVGGSGEENPTPGGQVDKMIATYSPAGSPAGAKPLITIPIIPHINSTSRQTCSYRKSVYGEQQKFNPYVTLGAEKDQCGNGFEPNGNQILDTKIGYNHVDNTPALQKQWVQHLVKTHGTGIVHYFQLDNEPYGWGNTHVDVEPDGVEYSTIVYLGEQYAAAIKQAEPSAVVFGPSDFTDAGWIGNPKAQDGLFAGEFYLRQFAKYDKQRGSRSLDYFDEHYYGPEGSNPAEIQSTRALWDPTYKSGNWVESTYFKGPMRLLPRFHEWIKAYYPGTKLSLSEYSVTNGDHGGKTIYEALTQADALGIFGREGLDFANLWTIPKPSDPVAFSFRLFRNYDGEGSEYGNEWVSSASADQTKLAVYGARRTSDGALTLIVINKTAEAITGNIALAHFSTTATTAAVYQYSGANLAAIVPQPAIALVKRAGGGQGFSASFPAYSATVVAIARK